MKSMRDLINLTEGTIVGRTLEDTLNTVDDQSHGFSDPVTDMSAEELMPNVGFEESSDNDPSEVVVRQTSDRIEQLLSNFVDPSAVVDTITTELQEQGYSEEEIARIIHRIDTGMQGAADTDDVPDDYADDGYVDNGYDDMGDRDYGEENMFSEDLDNGYDDTHTVDGNDFFPNGADSPVTTAVGPSGAHYGDNPEQKKMQVSEVHKELVYGYRSFLKESAAPTK